MKGCFCKILTIDATQKNFFTKDLDANQAKKAIGGKGVAAKLLLDLNLPGIDPLAPESHLIIASGPLSQSTVYGSSRYGVFAKSPLTGAWGESYSGGNFAGPLTSTGFDVVVIRGASEKPVWLEIHSDGVVFHDAGDVWGKNTFETEDYLKQKINAKQPGIMVIGPAGENLVRFAVIKNDRHRVAGRTGMGAVLGSKKIKGIVCYGEIKPDLHDPEAIKTYNKQMLAREKESKVVQAYRNMGTPMMVDLVNKNNAFPTQYWKKGRFEKISRINAQAMGKALAPKPNACRHCFLGCGKSGRVQNGRHKGLTIEGPEYETIYAFGGLCLIDEIEEIAHLNWICDSLGVDTISCGNLAGLAIEASKQGKISDRLTYGAADDVSRLIENIVKKQGVGEILARGIVHAGRELDMQDWIVHVKGMEPAGYDPRVLKGMGLACAVSERGACHLRTTFYKAELSGMVDASDLKDSQAVSDMVALFIDFEDRCTLFDSFILCRFFRDLYPWEELSKILYLVTGFKYEKTDLQQIAADIKDNTRRFNLREGLTSADDTLPERIFTNKLETGENITKQELQTLVTEYYKQRGWNTRGVPLQERLV